MEICRLIKVIDRGEGKRKTLIGKWKEVEEKWERGGRERGGRESKGRGNRLRQGKEGGLKKKQKLFVFTLIGLE